MVDVDSAYFDLGKGKKKRIVVGIDVFSRRLAARSVARLSAKEVDKALASILDELGPVERVRFDRGAEYNNTTVMSSLKRRKINYVLSYPPNKSNYVERVIRTLKTSLYKMAQYKGDSNWEKFLSDIVSSYNSRKHSALGMSPSQVSAANVPELWYRFKNQRLRHMPPLTPFHYDLNDCVRVHYQRQIFHKDYFEQNSTMVYYISTRYTRAHINRYHLKDQRNKAVPGSFVRSQLELTYVDHDTEYRIQEVLHYKVINGILHAKIRWQNYSAAFDSYIPAADIIHIHDENASQEGDTSDS